MAFVYVLLSDEPARTYVGWTLDVERRVRQHNAGTGARFTRGRRWTLVHVEPCADAPAAMRRERALKRDRAFRAALRAQGAARAGL
jgi:putative endonuclease